MKKLTRLIRLELTACLRQLRESARCGTAEGVLMVAFLLILSAGLAWARMSGLGVGAVLLPLFAGSALLGAAVFNRMNALELLAGKEIHALRAMPAEPGTVLLIKAEKQLFAGGVIFAAVIAAVSAAMLLAGYALVPIALGGLCCCAAFCLGQNARMALLVRGSRAGLGRAVALAAGIAALIACRKVLRGSSPMALFERAAGAYTSWLGAILALLLAGLAMVKLLLYRSRGAQVRSASEEASPAIPAPIERFLRRLDPVLRRDLRGMLHNPRERRALLKGLAGLPLLAWGGALLMRFEIVPMELTPRLSLGLILLLTAGAAGGLFARPLTMGYEGSMILVYMMSGQRVSQLQLRRVGSILALTMPVCAIMGLVSGLLLGCGAADLLLCLPAGLCACAACAAIEGYAAIRGTSWYNDMAKPRTSSRLLGQMARAALEAGYFAGAALAGQIPGGDRTVILAWGGLCALAACAACWKIQKGDAKFYGEYQAVAV